MSTGTQKTKTGLRNIAGTDINPATSDNQTTIIGHIDGIESVLNTIDTDTGNIATHQTDGTQKTMIVDSTGTEIDSATSAKQDTLLTELQRKADLTETQPVYDLGNNLILRELLESLNKPLWYDPTTNRLNIGGSVAATISSGTVTTLTGQTNIGGIPADPMVPNMLNQTWCLGLRSFLT